MNYYQEKLTKLPSRPAPMVAIMADRRTPYEIVAQVIAMVGNVGINSFLPVMPAERQTELRYKQ